MQHVEAATKTIAGQPTKQRAERGGNVSAAAAVAHSQPTAYHAAGDPPPAVIAFSTAPAAPPADNGMQRFDSQFAALIDLAARLGQSMEAGSLLVMLEGTAE